MHRMLFPLSSRREPVFPRHAPWRPMFIALLFLVCFHIPVSAAYLFMKDGTIIEGNASSDGGGGYFLGKKDGTVLRVAKGDVLRLVQGNSFFERKEIKLRNAGILSGYIVHEDEFSVTLRRSLTGAEEQRIAKDTILQIGTADSRGRLRPEELAKKREGWYFNGIPFISYNTDNGFIFGGRGFFFLNGPKHGEFYDREPYSIRAFLHLYFSTSGYMLTSLNFDAYHLAGTSIRLQTSLEYEHNINANYFGIGRKVAERGLVDNLGRQYSTARDYDSNFLLAGNHEYAKFTKVRVMTPRYYFNISAEPVKYLKLLAGFELNYAFVESWDGREFMYECVNYRAANDSLFTREPPPGAGGGWTNFIRLGIAWDTRDFAPDPHNGMLIDFTLESSGRMIGSAYEYHRATFGARFYTPLGIDSLILAGRLGFTAGIGDIPFYEMGIFPFMFERTEGLKHNSHLKGYKFARYVGNTQLAANLELRWKFLEYYHRESQNRFAFQLVAFVDAKNIWDETVQVFTDHRFQNYKFSYGASLIIAWNLATVMRISFGFSPEDFAISMSFGQSF